MGYQLRFSPLAADRLRSSDPVIAERIYKKAKRLAEHFDDVRHLALSGPFAGSFKLRVGDYRIIYSIRHEEKMVYVETFKHRKDSYKEG